MPSGFRAAVTSSGKPSLTASTVPEPPPLPPIAPNSSPLLHFSQLRCYICDWDSKSFRHHTVTSLGTRITALKSHYLSRCPSHTRRTFTMCPVRLFYKGPSACSCKESIGRAELQATGWCFPVILGTDAEYVKWGPGDVHAQCPS